MVVSSAVKADNPEVLAARAARIPVVRRAEEMLAELMRLKMAVAVAGTHGKTTTTSLMAALFDAAGLAPTVINGGIINAYGTNARIGSGEWIVAEADESDGTFIKLPATIAVITNIDAPEHLNYFGSFDNLRAAFQQFVENLPFYGFGVLCIDHPEVQTLIGKVRDRRIMLTASHRRRMCGRRILSVRQVASVLTLNARAKDLSVTCFYRCTASITCATHWQLRRSSTRAIRKRRRA